MLSTETRHTASDFLFSPVQSRLAAQGDFFCDDQLQEAVPHKTPRNLTIPRRRFVNSTFEFFTGAHFSMFGVVWGLGLKLSPIGYAVFDFFGGEQAFLFRLTPF